MRSNSLLDNPQPPRAAVEISLAELDTSGVAVAWGEAVAIVQQVAKALGDQPGTPCVDPSVVFLQASGHVVLRTPRSGNPATSVSSVGELLRGWVSDTPFPMALNRVIANATASPPSYNSVGELSQALAQYERADRRELVRAVYERARASHATWASATRPEDGRRAHHSRPADPATEYFASETGPEEYVARPTLRQSCERMTARMISVLRTKSAEAIALVQRTRDQWLEGRARATEHVPSAAGAERLPHLPTTERVAYTKPTFLLVLEKRRRQRTRIIWAVAVGMSIALAIVFSVWRIAGVVKRPATSAALATGAAVNGVNAPVNAESASASQASPASAFPSQPPVSLAAPSAVTRRQPQTSTSERGRPRAAASSLTQPQQVGREVHAPNVTRATRAAGIARPSAPAPISRTTVRGAVAGTSALELQAAQPPRVDHVPTAPTAAAPTIALPTVATSATTQPAIAPSVPLSRQLSPQAATSPTAHAPTAGSRPDQAIVYSRADGDVSPPVAIEAQLFDSPPPIARQQFVAAIDLVIDEHGRVESATLLRRPANMREAVFATMSLSAAKMWRFQPARKGDQPVKYRRSAWLVEP